MSKRFKTKEELYEQYGSLRIDMAGSVRTSEAEWGIYPHCLGRSVQDCLDKREFNEMYLEDWMWVEDPRSAMSSDTSESEVAKRYNTGKIDLSLIPIEATLRECEVWQDGEAKYGRDNWKKLWGDDTINVACASALRHMFAILNGEKDDPESGKPHAAHVRCNMAMILEYYKKGEL